MSADQEYMPVKPYFARNTAETAKLQREAGDLRAITDDPQTPWLERTRAAERLKTVERELQAARMADRLAGHAAAHQQAAAPGTRTRVIRERPGTANPGATLILHEVAPEPEPEFLEPRAYFEEPSRSVRNARRGVLVVNVASGVMGAGVR